jgi:hypothetical protein
MAVTDETVPKEEVGEEETLNAEPADGPVDAASGDAAAGANLDAAPDATSGDAVPDTGLDAQASRRRRRLWAAVRAAAVLVVAVVVYQLVIPQTHVVRTRLSGLTLLRPGVARYNVKTPQAGEQPASGTQLAAVVAAAKKAPNQTGVYAITWAPSQTSGAGVIVYLLPSTAQAEAALPQLRAQQAAAGSYTSQGFSRRSTYTVGAVPGSSGATYTPTSKSSGTGELGVTTFRYGRVVAAVEVFAPSGTEADAATMTTSEYNLLKRVEPGFTLKKVTRPVLASSLWIVGALVLALIVALTPGFRSWRAERRQRRIDEELSHIVVVRGQTISKHRR